MQLRIPSALQRRLKDAGRKNGRSLRGELLARLRHSLDEDGVITAREQRRTQQAEDKRRAA